MTQLSAQNSRRGFTLIEVVVAIGILVLALGGAMSLIILTRESEEAAQGSLVATYLAREGLELTRYVRDANYANDTDFYTGIANPDDPYTYSFIMDFTGPASISAAASDDPALAPVIQRYENNYQYSVEAEAVDTFFRRLITTTYHPAASGQAAFLDVRVDVYWNRDGKKRTYSLSGQLVDWR